MNLPPTRLGDDGIEAKRRSRRNSRLVILSLIAVILIGYVFKLVYDAGGFKTLRPHFAGECQAIEGIAGAEDMEIDTVENQLFISSDNRAEKHGDPTPDGAIYRLDLEDPKAKPVRMTSTLPFSFHPHGLGLLRDSQGLRLFVVNHRQKREQELKYENSDQTENHLESIEIFDINSSGLIHVKSIFGDELVTPNDVAPVDREKFYVTNDHGSARPFLQSIESYTRVGRGNLLFFDGTQFHIEVSGLSFANGIRLSLDRKKLYLAETLGRAIRIYDRDGLGLKEASVIELGTAPDNVDIALDGNLWIGAHPNLFKLKSASHDHSQPAPAQIIKVSRPDSLHPVIEEVFLDDGKKISAASVGVSEKGQLYIGSIFDQKMLNCKFR